MFQVELGAVFVIKKRNKKLDKVRSVMYDDDDEDEEAVDDPSYPEDVPDDDTALFVVSRKGKTVLQYNGHRYRRAYKSKNGTRWVCSKNKNCSAFLYLNDNNEIIMAHENHMHPRAVIVENIDDVQNDTAVVITSRKGKEMLLFRQYTYRKQYDRGYRARWVCSTQKNCHACVFTDSNNYITSAFEEHCHDPPKYYLKPDHVLDALREPIILETD